MEVKAYNLRESHIQTIKEVSKQNGDSGDSAALRYIIEDYQRRAECPPVPIIEATPEQAAQILEALGIEDVGSFATEVAKLKRETQISPEGAAGA